MNDNFKVAVLQFDQDVDLSNVIKSRAILQKNRVKRVVYID